MNKIAKIILVLAVSIASVSCNDFFELKPSNEMVLEEFWQSEDDVLSMTASCYRAMQEQGFMQRLIVWGEFRSDNTILGYNTGTDLNYIGGLNILPSNGYASWDDFYRVINYCNTVEHFAPGVRDVDPNFTESQLRAYIAEVKAIRAFCYFTLVRTFRDIPFITEPVIDDTQSFQVPQSDPDEIIDFLIEDLISVEEQAIAKWSSKSYTKGRMTQAAIRTIIADMCLWRGRYQDCITYCDKVLSDGNNVLSLESSNLYNRNVFIDGNSTESIFELQFSRNNIANYALCDFYGTYGGSGSGHQQMMAFDFSTTDLFADTDLRGYDAFQASSSLTMFPIKKYIAYRTQGTKIEEVRSSDYTAVDAGECNWIMYRLSDIYLMKAEAMVELNIDLEDAFELVSRTYNRANPDAVEGSFSFDNYSSQVLMRELVFDERQREFMFEGKRYFDLVRRVNRERDQFRTIMSKYLLRKYADLDQSTVSSKLSDFDAIYMPIKDTELKANKALVQNPFYSVTTDIVKN